MYPIIHQNSSLSTTFLLIFEKFFSVCNVTLIVCKTFTMLQLLSWHSDKESGVSDEVQKLKHSKRLANDERYIANRKEFFKNQQKSC
jgi:hypothetical protein